MTPWWLLILGGLLGSAHCIGMCGAFAAMIGLQTSSPWRNVRAQLAFSAGRIVTYAALGGMAGFAGKRLVSWAPQAANIPAVLCVLAGGFLLYEGWRAAGFGRGAVQGSSAAGCLLGPLFSAMLRTPQLRNTFVAGIFTGLLPCGLVYAFVSLAASTGDLLLGAATMACFGVGTIPALVVTGVGATLITPVVRQRLWRLAAVAVMATGVLTMARGAAFARWSTTDPPPRCPFCAGSATPGAIDEAIEVPNGQQ